ncbi:unnamed protein product [Prorocentrum cordatum]|nr:unnamed protein product [Polarella glacialis]
MQEILVMLPIPPFSGMSDMHSRLFYSTALCYECLLVSLLHLHAWRPDEVWYGDDGLPGHRSESRELELSALTHGTGSFADDGGIKIGASLGDSL